MANAEAVLLPQPRPLFIDALNLAYWCGNPPSLRLPLALLRQLLADGQEALLYFDASAPYALRHEAALYEALMLHAQRCIQVPSGRSADGVLLRQARANGGCIVSRDHFRDHRRRYRKLIDDPSRVLPGWVAQERLLIPALALDIPLPALAADAFALLQPWLTSNPEKAA